jgi:hypothetical protein
MIDWLIDRWVDKIGIGPNTMMVGDFSTPLLLSRQKNQQTSELNDTIDLSGLSRH